MVFRNARMHRLNYLLQPETNNDDEHESRDDYPTSDGDKGNQAVLALEDGVVELSSDGDEEEQAPVVEGGDHKFAQDRTVPGAGFETRHSVGDVEEQVLEHVGVDENGELVSSEDGGEGGVGFKSNELVNSEDASLGYPESSQEEGLQAKFDADREEEDLLCQAASRKVIKDISKGTGDANDTTPKGKNKRNDYYAPTASVVLKKDKGR